jgi:TRAP-type mannitol/chloroaromatic compound transport system substrate-binding protein
MRKSVWVLGVAFLVVLGFGSSAWSATPQWSWRMQVIHSTAHSNFAQTMQTAQDISKATNGRLEIKVSPNGTFSSSLEGFQACGDGVFEMHISWPVYAKGIEYAFLPLSNMGLGLDFIDKYVWMYEYGGWELMQKAFDKLNLKLLALEIWSPDVLMSNRPFKSIAEMKGRKMRTSDPRLLAKNNIAGITLPLEEVFTGFQTGSVDMAEFGDLRYNQGLGLTDIAKYGIYPDFWNTHFVTTVVVNKAAWNKLPADVQAIVEMGFKSREIQHWTKNNYLSAVAMRDLTEKKKMTFIRMDKDSFIELRKQMYQIEQEDSKKYGGLTAETYKSLYKFMEVWYPYKQMSGWWGNSLTAEQWLGFKPGTHK